MLKRVIGFGQRGAEATLLLLRYSAIHMDGNDERRVLLDVSDSLKLNTFREILILFVLSHFRIFIRARFSRWVLYVARMLPWHKSTRLIWRTPRESEIPVLCTNAPPPPRASDKGVGKVIRLCSDYNPNLALPSGHFAFPYPMHPQIYVQYKGHERLDLYRKGERKVRAFFAGNYNQAGYDSPTMKELFGLLTRFQILDLLQSENLVRVISSREELDAVLSGEYCNQFLISDSRSVRINQNDWLEMVSKADFFLCPPGVVFPLCHNAIEAMAVGTIPLTNYPDWFLPHLTPDANCIAFSTLDQLRDSVKRILSLRVEQITPLREGVNRYYTESLSPTNFVDRITASPEKLVYLHVLDEDEDVLRRAMKPGVENGCPV